MPNRVLREGILTSERIDQLASWASECFYRRLMSVVDDFGRYYANPSLLRAACFPLKLDKVSNADVDKWLADCAGAGLVSTYEFEGRRYLQMRDFRQQVRADKSRFPHPPADAAQVHSKCVADAQHLPANEHLGGDGDVDGGEDSAEPRGSPPVASFTLNDGTEFAVSQALLDEWAQAFPAVNVLQELREIRAWCMAHPAKRKTRRGAQAFVIRWLGKEQDRGNAFPPKSDKFAGLQ